MANTDDRQSYKREVSADSYYDQNGQTHTKVTRTEQTINHNQDNSSAESYQNGYVNGVVSERRSQENLAERDNNNVATGLLLGIGLASLAAITAGTVWFFNQRNETVNNTAAPVVVPIPSKSASPSPSPQTKQAPEKQTTIIERTRDVPVPVLVPQPAQTSAPKPTPPQININIPKNTSVPPVETAPTPTTPTQSSSNDTTNSTGTQSDRTTSTVEQEKSNQTESDNSSNSTDNSSTNGSNQ